ncbi:thioredoxin family protein [Sinomicrobium soli]|uniref:thioredoxin family protein n=1 Tax=Sinomicrobium sp. N-1-3-6 TaxID=2219864 RepID=UPI000DCF32B2|nr:DUF255 domain-containing protein [Sinomicrobium sp. N-1-3-6]RAV30667.1 thioredoxin [Sinomicrobium sp. N-1-3-6]
MWILFLCMGLLAAVAQDQENTAVEWLSWEEAIARQQTDETPRKIFVDVYTDWCGWCKKMDKDTFSDKEVAEYVKDKFYMVKLDGEGKEEITYNGRTFKFVPAGRRGYHELAAALLNNRLSYPTGVFLNERQQLLFPVPGYHDAERFMKVARYVGENIYEDTSWDDYNAAVK